MFKDETTNEDLIIIAYNNGRRSGIFDGVMICLAIGAIIKLLW